MLVVTDDRIPVPHDNPHTEEQTTDNQVPQGGSGEHVREERDQPEGPGLSAVAATGVWSHTHQLPRGGEYTRHTTTPLTARQSKQKVLFNDALNIFYFTILWPWSNHKGPLR